MAKTKFEFGGPNHYDIIIENPDGTKFADLRIKPSTFLVSPLGKHSYRSIGIEELVDWVVNNPNSKDVKS
jgi:hypothetical protein